MEKVFEALEFIFSEALFSEYKNETHSKVRECNDIVLNALTELQAIKEAKPNEALKCLKLLGDFNWYNKPFKEAFPDLFNTIEQTLLKAQEQEKENAEYKQLEEKIECPLEVLIKAKQGFFTNKGFISPEHIYTIDLLNGTIDFEYLKADGFWNEEGQVYIKDHKKTWWIKEDKSE